MDGREEAGLRQIATAVGFGPCSGQLAYRLLAPTVTCPKASDDHCAGNLINLFQDGLAYNFKLVEKYGGVFKVFGLLGVSSDYLR